MSFRSDKKAFKQLYDMTPRMMKKDLKKSLKTRQQMIDVILKFRKGYYLEDENGVEFTDEQIKNLSNEDLKDAFKMIIEDLHKYYGDPEHG